MSDLSLLAHRVIGRVNISAPEEPREEILISRVLVSEINNPDHWIIAEAMNFDGVISLEDTAFIRERGVHCQTWPEVVDAYNADDFDPNDWEMPECVCGECEKVSGN